MTERRVLTRAAFILAGAVLASALGARWPPRAPAETSSQGRVAARGGGCSCDAGAAPGGTGWTLTPALAGLALARARRRARRRRPRRPASWALALIVGGLAAASGCRRGDTPGAHLSVGVSLLRISLPVFVAGAEGLFRAQGLDVELRPYETAQPLMDDVVADRLDAGGFVAYPIAFLAAQHAAQGPRLATALVEDREHRLSYALVPSSSALRFPDDVAGRVVGVLPTVAYQRWLEAILHAAGVEVTGVKVVPLAPPLQGRALASGAVDFLFTNDPVATNLLVGGVARLADRGPDCPRFLGEPFAFGSFALSARLADERPREAAQLVAAIDDAIAALERDPSTGPRAMSPFLRPEERPAVWRFPPTRYLASQAVGAEFVAAEARREIALGILRDLPSVTSWMPPR